MKNLRKKIAIMVLAGLCSALFSLVTPVAVAAAGECSLGLNSPEGLVTEIKNKAEGMKVEELETCINKIGEYLNPCLSNPVIAAGAKEGCQQYHDAGFALSDAIIAKQVSLPIEDFIKTPEIGVTDISAPGNLCICVPTSEEGDTCTDANNIIAVVEEPMETELTNTDQTKVRTCTRNTFCVEREEGKEMQCITYLNAKKTGEGKDAKYEPFCSGEGQQYMKDNPGKASLYCQPVQVFLSNTGTGLLFTYISTIYKWAASVIGIIAVLVIVISGIQISAAAGEQQAVTNAKNRIIQTLGGLALLFLSAIILYTINPNFFTAG